MWHLVFVLIPVYNYHIEIRREIGDFPWHAFQAQWSGDYRIELNSNALFTTQRLYSCTKRMQYMYVDITKLSSLHNISNSQENNSKKY